MEEPTSTGFQILLTSAYRHRMRGLVTWALASSTVLVFSMIFLVARTASAWSPSQDRLFVSSIFPTAPSWLGFAIACPAAVLLVSAVTPITDHRSTTQRLRPNP